MNKLLLGVVALALGVAGCTSSSGGPPSSGSQSAGITHVTGLAPCPTPGRTSTAAHRLPDLTLACLGTAGGPVALRALTGTPTVLNLYASWCGPCQQELPGFADFAGKAAGRVRVIGVDTKDTAGSAGDLLAKSGVHYASVYDEDGKLFNALGGSGLPMTILVDPSGAVAAVHPGQLTEPELVELVASKLGVHLTST